MVSYSIEVLGVHDRSVKLGALVETSRPIRSGSQRIGESESCGGVEVRRARGGRIKQSSHVYTAVILQCQVMPGSGECELDSSG